jgi:hypothetical protein
MVNRLKNLPANYKRSWQLFNGGFGISVMVRYATLLVSRLVRIIQTAKRDSLGFNQRHFSRLLFIKGEYVIFKKGTRGSVHHP